ncbi:tetratricopeptide repeat protein [Streptomyces sp. NBC_01304]|uniref:tetratricopeptide repeat protein n=1 Tax=Streptomyces sp. NBC_01304 TaxID=2903818 RepID=UPI002E0F8973|nr:hypothetical protein OG430_30040 [Streptomyces sp. NBC_01304]
MEIEPEPRPQGRQPETPPSEPPPPAATQSWSGPFGDPPPRWPVPDAEAPPAPAPRPAHWAEATPVPLPTSTPEPAAVLPDGPSAPAADAAGPTPPAPRRGLSPKVKRALVVTVAASTALAGVLMIVPALQGSGTPPALGPVGRARAAAGAGAPASLRDLGALIRDREAHLAQHPGDEESWAVLGAAYVDHGRRVADYSYYPRAEEALNKSLAAKPGDQGNIEALSGMAALAHARHDYRAAKKWGELAVMQAPQRWTLYPDLIDTYGRLGDHKSVGKALEKLQELRSGSAVMARASQVFRDRGWREDAAAAISDAAALAETPAERAAYLHRIGELSWERGEAAEALRYFDEALRTDPDHHPSLAGRARAQAALGRHREAMLSYQAALTKQPLPEYNLELGELQESLGQEAAARVQYGLLRDRIKKEAGLGVSDELVLGMFEADHGDPDAAVQRLQAEYRRHPSRQATDALGWALYRAGDHKRAFGYVKRAMEKGPRSALFVYHRGQIERALEEFGAARRHLQEALRLNPAFSPLLVPLAKEALDALGEPSEGGPENMHGQAPQAPEYGRPSSGGGQQVRPGKPGRGSGQGGGSGQPKQSGSRETYRKSQGNGSGQGTSSGQGTGSTPRRTPSTAPRRTQQSEPRRTQQSEPRRTAPRTTGKADKPAPKRTKQR